MLYAPSTDSRMQAWRAETQRCSLEHVVHVIYGRLAATYWRNILIFSSLLSIGTAIINGPKWR